MGFKAMGRPVWARPARAMALGATALSDLASAIGVHSEEAALVAELKAGSEEAYAWLIAQYHQPVYSVVFRILGDAADAADTTQEVFLKVFRGMRSFNGQASLKTWIYRIALHEASNRRRWWFRHKSQEVTIEAESPEQAGDNTSPALKQVLADPGNSPFDSAVQHELQARVEAELREVSEPFRTTVILRDIEELSYEEIAEIMQTSLGTVKSRVTRGREALRKRLENYARELGIEAPSERKKPPMPYRAQAQAEVAQ
jgi:RNA polymerase sigma-70 factor (ECF subfamily)